MRFVDVFIDIRKDSIRSGFDLPVYYVILFELQCCEKYVDCKKSKVNFRITTVNSINLIVNNAHPIKKRRIKVFDKLTFLEIKHKMNNANCKKSHSGPDLAHIPKFTPECK